MARWRPALFAGFYFRSSLAALAVPLLALSISDQFLGGYTPLVMLAVYAAGAAPIAWRAWLRRNLSPARVGVSSVASSVLFFAVTNFAVWCAWYPHTWDGFIRCYTVAVPFFGNTLRSDALFSAALFGTYAVAVRWSAQRRPAPIAATALQRACAVCPRSRCCEFSSVSTSASLLPSSASTGSSGSSRPLLIAFNF